MENRQKNAMPPRFTTSIALGLLLTVGWSSLAAAQAPIDEASRATARTLGREGIDAYRSKNFPTALEKLERAYRVVRVPSLALWSARALEKNGKLVEAAERYLDATRLPVTSGDQATQEQARADAAREREVLLPRLASLKIEAGTGVEDVTIDGVAVPPDLLGAPRPVNPGSHTVVASRDGVTKSEQVSLREGEQQSLRLELPPGPHPRKERKANATTGTSKPKDDTEKPAQESGGTQRAIGYSALVLGGVGATVGTVAGIWLMTKHNSSEVKTNCPNGVCTAEAESTANSFNTLRTVSTVGFIAGAVGLGAGVTLLLTTPKEPSQVGRITPWVGIGSIGVSGGF